MASEAPADRQAPYMRMFEVFRFELDDHHDRRERVTKASRDITAASKKIIFALQRVRQLNQDITPDVAKATATHKDTIKNAFRLISPDLQGINTYRYERNVSSGVQEWMEAISFQQYLQTQQLISLGNAQSELNDLAQEQCSLSLGVQDYILGVLDMTGELMRFAITSMATAGALPGTGETVGARNVLHDLQELRFRLETLDAGSMKELPKKVDVMKASVDKVEKALYGLVVRGSERPQGWMPDVRENPSIDTGDAERY